MFKKAINKLFSEDSLRSKNMSRSFDDRNHGGQIIKTRRFQYQRRFFNNQGFLNITFYWIFSYHANFWKNFRKPPQHTLEFKIFVNIGSNKLKILLVLLWYKNVETISFDFQNFTKKEMIYSHLIFNAVSMSNSISNTR